MYYAAESNIKSNVYAGGRKLRRTDGIFPTTTMLLHERIVGWHRKRRIPVRYADKANNLNAYLIDPKYLDNGEVVLPKELPEPTETPTVSIPIYQYSKITRDFEPSGYATSGPLTQAMNRMLSVLRVGFTALGAELSNRYQAFISPKPTTHYAVNEGVLPWWRHRVKMFAAALLTGGLIVAAATIDTTTSGKPTPVSANPGPATSAKITNSGPAHASSMPTSATQNASAMNASVSTSSSLPATSQTTLPYQKQVTTPTTQATTQTSNTTTNVSSTTATAPSGSSTSTPPSSTTPTTSPLAPVTDPVTGLIQDVLSTQITVTTPIL